MSEQFNSASDRRIESNVMRHAYRELNSDEKIQMQRIKDLGLSLYDFLDAIGASRELSLAKTKLEEAVMWAVKHITKRDYPLKTSFHPAADRHKPHQERNKLFGRFATQQD